MLLSKKKTTIKIRGEYAMSNEEKILDLLTTLVADNKEIKEHLYNVETRLDNLENRFDDLESRFDNLEKDVKEMKDDIKYLKGGQEFIRSEIFSKDGLIQYMDDKFAAIDRRFEDLEANLEVINERQYATDVKVAKLKRVK